MKMFKLSLATMLAAGALATTASAVAFEEAIKDVDVSGMARIRYTTVHNNDGNSKATWNFRGMLNVNTKIDDNFSMMVGIRYNSHNDSSYSQSTSSDGNKFDVYRGYLAYAVGGTQILAGRQRLTPVGTMFTDDMYGDGFVVLNTDIQGLILGALFMDALEADGDIGTKGIDLLGLGSDNIAVATGKSVTDHNLWGAAMIGNYDPVSFQIWDAYLQDVANLFAVELGVNVKVSDDTTIGLKGQYANTHFDSGFKRDVDGAILSVIGTQDLQIDDSNFWAIQAEANFFGVDFSAGYVNFEADSKNGVSLTSFEDNGQFIQAGEELVDYSAYIGENDYWFVTAGYTIPGANLRIGADYLDGEFTNDVNVREVVARATYKHNKKLSFNTWYSNVKEDADKTDTWRFEAKYTF